MYIIIEHIDEISVKIIGRYNISAEFLYLINLKDNQKIIHEDYLDCFNVVENKYIDDGVPF